MRENAQWVYDVDTGGGEPPTLGIFEVIERQGTTVRIANNRGMDRTGNVRHGDYRGGYRDSARGIAGVVRDLARWRAGAGVLFRGDL